MARRTTLQKSNARKAKRITKAVAKGKTKKAKRVSKKLVKNSTTGRTGAGRVVKRAKGTAAKIKKKIDRLAGSKVGKIAKAVAGTVKAVKRGSVSKAAKGVSDTVKAVTAKRSYPKKVKKATMKKPVLSKKAVARKTKAINRKQSKIASMKKERLQLAKELMTKYGKEGYNKIKAGNREGRKFTGSLPESDKRKIRKINTLYSYEQQKGKAVKRKQRKISKSKR